MEPASSIPHSQEPATSPYSEHDEQLHILIPHFLRCIFNIIRPFTLVSQVFRPELEKYSYLYFLVRKSAFLNMGGRNAFYRGPSIC
jgi:hypothetical protein